MKKLIRILAISLIFTACETTPPATEGPSPEVLPEAELRAHQGRTLPEKVKPGTIDDFYWQVRERLIDSQQLKYPKKNLSMYQWFFKTEKPMADSRWTSQSILLFPNAAGKVMQMAFESYDCGIGISLEDQATAKDNFNALLKRETNEFLGQEVVMSDNDFKALGPKLSVKVRALLAKNIVGASKVRLSRGKYKCDAKGGHGYRLDIFLDN